MKAHTRVPITSEVKSQKVKSHPLPIGCHRSNCLQTLFDLADELIGLHGCFTAQPSLDGHDNRICKEIQLKLGEVILSVLGAIAITDSLKDTLPKVLGKRVLTVDLERFSVEGSVFIEIFAETAKVDPSGQIPAVQRAVHHFIVKNLIDNIVFVFVVIIEALSVYAAAVA